MQLDMTDVRKTFRERQFKLTPQRQIILQAFLNHQDEHLCAEDVHQIVRREAPEIGLATVYRTLDLLSELDLLQKMDFGDGRSRYEINGPDTGHHHHHLICVSCGKVKEFEDDLLDSLEAVISERSKFQIVDHQVKFYGYCQECQKKNDA